MKELICIVCPRGCHLQVDENNGYAVTGNACPRGEAYGREELLNPQRTLTSTVRIHGAELERLPVKTSKPIPKGDIFKVMALLDEVDVQAPVRLGDIILEGKEGAGSDIVATRSL